MDNNTLQILIAMVIYMAAVAAIGVLYAKRANKNSEEYFLGGRSLGPWVTAMSAEAAAVLKTAAVFLYAQSEEQMGRGQTAVA